MSDSNAAWAAEEDCDPSSSGGEGCGRLYDVVTCLHGDGQSVLAIPRPWAVAALTTYSVLAHAMTFGDARQDVAAGHLVDGWLDSYIERQQEQEQEQDEVVLYGEDDDPFDADDYWGMDHWRVWRPDAREATADFITQNVPELEDFLQPDTSWGTDYDPQPYIAPEDRDRLEAALRQHGYRVTRQPNLAELYLSPGFDPLANLRDAP